MIGQDYHIILSTNENTKTNYCQRARDVISITVIHSYTTNNFQ